MFAYKNDDSLLGPISFNADGDPSGSRVPRDHDLQGDRHAHDREGHHPKQATVNAALGK